MITLVFILWLVLAVMLLLVVAMRPVRTKHSLFELQRKGDQAALDRERLLGDVYAYRRTIAVLLIVLLTVVGWAVLLEKGLLVVIIALPIILLISRWRPIARYATGLYNGQERHLLRFASRWPTAGWLLGSDRHPPRDQKLESTEQLLHLVESAGHILTSDQQHLIKQGLQWHTTVVTDVMTPVNRIVSLPSKELLGPLVLDDLHKSGHHRFPVTKGGIDHIVGMVNITELLRVDAIQKSLTAEKAMTPIDVRIPDDAMLPNVLEGLLHHPAQLGIVTDSDGKTKGLVTITDVTKHLVGRL